MEKEFKSLSEKIYDGAIQTPHIKEFIKRLKEEFSDTKVSPHKVYKKPHEIYEICIKIIDKLAGNKLI